MLICGVRGRAEHHRNIGPEWRSGGPIVILLARSNWRRERGEEHDDKIVGGSSRQRPCSSAGRCSCSCCSWARCFSGWAARPGPKNTIVLKKRSVSTPEAAAPP